MLSIETSATRALHASLRCLCALSPPHPSQLRAQHHIALCAHKLVTALDSLTTLVAQAYDPHAHLPAPAKPTAPTAPTATPAAAPSPPAGKATTLLPPPPPPQHVSPTRWLSELWPLLACRDFFAFLATYLAPELWKAFTGSRAPSAAAKPAATATQPQATAPAAAAATSSGGAGAGAAETNGHAAPAGLPRPEDANGGHATPGAPQPAAAAAAGAQAPGLLPASLHGADAADARAPGPSPRQGQAQGRGTALDARRPELLLVRRLRESRCGA